MNSSSRLGVSAAMRTVASLLKTYASVRRNVLLLGPTGVGKGLVARILHAESGASGAFTTVAGGQLSDTLFHSQLFGHLRGAFTDAKDRVKGAFEQAMGGTLFLDEIPHWSTVVQSSLLVPLGEGIYRPLGSERDLSVGCRIVFASTIHPDQLVQEARMLPDLRWRLPQIQIRIPALRERKADILWLAGVFLDEFSAEHEPVQKRSFSVDAIQALLGHTWPGNVRELRNTVDLAIIHAHHAGRSMVELEDFPCEMAAVAPSRVGDAEAETLQCAIEWALGRSGGNQTEAARLLGVHRNTVSRRRDFPLHTAPQETRSSSLENQTLVA